MGQSFEVTREGVKLSYLRFLSDSAAGYILLLLFGVAYRECLPLPIVGYSWLSLVPSQMSTELKVLLLMISFLMATPLGLGLNGISWFLLGPFPVWMLELWGLQPAKRLSKALFLIPSLLIAGTRRSYQVNAVTRFFRLETSHFRQEGDAFDRRSYVARFFGLDPSHASAGEQSLNGRTAGDLYEQANYYQTLLRIYFPSCLEQLDPTRGLKRFFRSTSFLALMTSGYSFFFLPASQCAERLRFAALSLITFIILLLFNSLLEYHQRLAVLFMTYVLASELHSSNPTRERIVQHLIELSGRLHSTPVSSTVSDRPQ